MSFFYRFHVFVLLANLEENSEVSHIEKRVVSFVGSVLERCVYRLCTEVCVELELGALAVSALVHGARIAEAEGGSGSVGFLSSASLSADALFGRVRTIAHYDEAAAVSGALKVGLSFLVSIHS